MLFSFAEFPDLDSPERLRLVLFEEKHIKKACFLRISARGTCVGSGYERWHHNRSNFRDSENANKYVRFTVFTDPGNHPNPPYGRPITHSLSSRHDDTPSASTLRHDDDRAQIIPWCLTTDKRQTVTEY